MIREKLQLEELVKCFDSQKEIEAFYTLTGITKEQLANIVEYNLIELFLSPKINKSDLECRICLETLINELIKNEVYYLNVFGEVRLSYIKKNIEDLYKMANYDALYKSFCVGKNSNGDFILDSKAFDTFLKENPTSADLLKNSPEDVKKAFNMIYSMCKYQEDEKLKN